MSDHLDLHSNQARVRWLEADVEADRWGSVAARKAVARTCQEVALRCQRVIARYASVDIPNDDRPNTSGSLDPDELHQVAIGDPDPTADLGTTTSYRPCGFKWVDETSPTLHLHWSCSRELGHPGQHLAGTGESVAAVHPAVATAGINQRRSMIAAAVQRIAEAQESKYGSDCASQSATALGSDR
jgi:hypothetical protein